MKLNLCEICSVRHRPCGESERPPGVSSVFLRFTLSARTLENKAKNDEEIATKTFVNGQSGEFGPFSRWLNSEWFDWSMHPLPLIEQALFVDPSKPSVFLLSSSFQVERSSCSFEAAYGRCNAFSSRTVQTRDAPSFLILLEANRSSLGSVFLSGTWCNNFRVLSRGVKILAA